METFRYRIEGRVQGVGFRYSTLRAARFLGIRGTVRNVSDGSVEVIAQAPQDLLAEFENYLEEGPAWGHVKNIKKTPVPESREYADFRIVP